MMNLPKMGLVAWNSSTDVWNHEELANNFRKLDEHDHSSGKGRQIPTGGIEDGAITTNKLSPEASNLADDSVDTRHIRNLAVTTPKLGLGSVTGDQLGDSSVGASKLRRESVYSRHLSPRTSRYLGMHTDGRYMTRFTPGVAGQAYGTGFVPGPRADGEAYGVKVNIPAGGGFLHVFAEGAAKLIPRGSPTVADHIQIHALIDISMNDQASSNVAYVGTQLAHTKVKQVQWAAYSGATLKDTVDLSGSSMGGVLTKFIPAGPSDITASVALKLVVVGAGTIIFGTQTLYAWTSGAPSYGGMMQSSWESRNI